MRWPAAAGDPRSTSSPPTRCSSGTTRSPAASRPCACGSRWAACGATTSCSSTARRRSGGLTRNALAASHVALVVAEPSLFALQGAAAALDAIELVRADNLRLRPAGILVNKVRGQSVEHRFRHDELRQTYGDLVLEPPLPDRAAVQQAEGACVPVQAWRSPGAREVSDALDDHLEHLLARPVDAGPLGKGRR